MSSDKTKMNGGEPVLATSETEETVEDYHWLERTASPPPEEVAPFWNMFVDNWLYVVTYCCVFGSFGVCVGFLGPTVFDLGCQTSSDLKQMNWVFFVQLIMTLVGSVSAGCMASRLHVHSLMLGAAVGVSVSMFTIPFCDSLATLIVILVVMGWCMGCLDCLANLNIIQMFGKNVGPFLQAMHCSYGVGAFVSPMIASAFLLNKDCSPFIDGFSVGSTSYNGHNNHTHVADGTQDSGSGTVFIPPQPQRVFRYRHMSKLPNAFYILGTLQLLIASLVAYVLVQERMGKVKPRVMSAGHFHGHGHGISLTTKCFHVDNLSSWVKETCCARGPQKVIHVTLLTCLSLFVFDGLQSSFANYIYTYAYESKVTGLHKYEGAILDACFWGLFTTGRLIAVPVAAKLTAASMLVINIVGCSLALLITIIFRWSHVVIYLGTCGVGLFVSSMSPTVMTMAEQFVDVTPSITTCMVVIAALGEALCPVIVGSLLVISGPGSFLVFSFTFSVIAIFLYLALFLTGRRTEKYTGNTAKGVAQGENSLIKPSSITYYSPVEKNQIVPEVVHTELQDMSPTKK